MKTVSLLAFAVGALAAAQSLSHAQSIVNLGTAATYGALAGTTVTSTGFTVVNGDLGTSPGATVTGFPAGVVNGSIHAGDAAAAQAHTDLITAYNAVTGQSATTSGVTAFATTTLTPGVYNSGASISLTGTLTLDGNNLANPVFVFQMGSTLLMNGGTSILLINGARAENVYWQVGSSATIGGTSVFVGTILANTSITVGTGATVDGRLLAIGGALDLASNTISVPVSAIPEPATTSLLVAGCFGLIVGIRRLRQRRAAQILFLSVAR
jgi:hypothetical protein